MKASPPNITPEQYAELKARYARHEAWRGGRGSYKPEEVPADCVISNEERSAIEVYEFITNPPDKYFLYVDRKTAKAITWTGETLGTIGMGTPYRDNFGGTRIPINVYAINGRKYHGTFFESAGDYARIAQFKKQPKQ